MGSVNEALDTFGGLLANKEIASSEETYTLPPPGEHAQHLSHHHQEGCSRAP